MFSPSGSQAILVFPYQMAWQYSDVNPPPLIGASNAGGVGRNRDSEPISGFTALLVRRQQNSTFNCTQDKSVAYVTNNKRLRCFVLLKLTTDRHEASRSLFATAELLVKKLGKMTIADKVMNPQHFRRDLADICIWINPDSNPRSIFVEILALAEVFAL